MGMKINDLLSMAIGRRLIYSRTGGGAGSIWVLELEGKMEFMIDCAWRIEYGDIVLTTCGDDSTPLTGRMNKSVEKLIGSKLLSYELLKHNDLILNFENDFLVRVFCSLGFEVEVKEDYPSFNWCFSVPSLDISVTITDHFQETYTKYYSNDFIEE